MATLTYNPFAHDIHENPYDTYRQLRNEAPVYWNDELEFWVLSRFDDVIEAFRDFETYTSTKGVALEQRGRVNEDFLQMIEMDPPDHTAFRKLVSRVFTGRRVGAMEDNIRSIVDSYLDVLIERGHGDLVVEVTGPFPMDVLAAIMGYPVEDRAHLREAADKILVREDGVMGIPDVGFEGIAQLLEYFAADLEKRKQGGGEGLVSDLIGLEVDGRALSDAELLGFCVLFVIAGHETTTKMVANAVELLDRHPDQKQALIDDPDLAPMVVEEVLRFHNSTQYMHRALTRDVTLHGVTMKEGDSVLLHIGAANHDEREFGDTAEEFDIHRVPDRHLGFGYGAHFCLGAALARLEGRIALEQIHRRMPNYRVDHDSKVRFHSSNVTGWTQLPVIIERAP